MIKVSEIIGFVTDIAPLHWQESYDNSGLLIGDPDAMVDKALLTLDVTEKVVDEAIENSFHLIISHHPLIFKGVKNIIKDITGLNVYEYKIPFNNSHDKFQTSKIGLASLADIMV